MVCVCVVGGCWVMTEWEQSHGDKKREESRGREGTVRGNGMAREGFESMGSGSAGDDGRGGSTVDAWPED